MRLIRVTAFALIVSACGSGTSTVSSEPTSTVPPSSTTVAPTTTVALATTTAPATTIATTTTTTEVTTTTDGATVTTQTLPTVTYEAEDLSGASWSTGLYVTVQDMTPWNGGTGWGGQHQLFVGGEQVGDWFQLVFPVVVTGSYVVQVTMTAAPDFANVKIAVDGVDVGGFGLYNPDVVPAGPIPLGLFTLDSGVLHSIRFTVVSKDPQSTGYKFGIDQIIVVGPGD